jgi:hypothetical protein
MVEQIDSGDRTIASQHVVQGQGVQLVVSRMRMGESADVERLLRRRSRAPAGKSGPGSQSSNPTSTASTSDHI